MCESYQNGAEDVLFEERNDDDEDFETTTRAKGAVKKIKAVNLGAE